MSVYALIPAKSLVEAKSRLSSAASPEERAAVSLEMLRSIVGQVRQVPAVDVCAVVSADAAVLEEARRLGAIPLPEQSPGLNRALEGARAWAVGQSAGALLVVLSDLPLASAADIAEVLRLTDRTPVALAPSKDGGTNVLALRPPDAIPFRFGRESARYHRFEAARRGLTVALLERDTLAFDVDTADDLAAYREVKEGRSTLADVLVPARP